MYGIIKSSGWTFVGLVLTVTLAVLTFLTPTVRGIAPWASVHCAVRREISPCTCRMQEHRAGGRSKSITVTCEGMINFQQVITALTGKFDKSVDIVLHISRSNLDDLPQLSFQHLGLTIVQLRLSHTNLSALPESVFIGLNKVESFGLTNNAIVDVPQQVLKLMPLIRVLDLNFDKIVNISSSDFQGLPLTALTMNGNCLQLLESNSIPSAVNKLTLSSNKIVSLNGTLRGLVHLQWLWINNNSIESLDGELPQIVPNTNMKLLSAENNLITAVPQDLRHFIALKHLTLNNNRITSLNGAISTTKRLEALEISSNFISTLYPYDFLELNVLQEIKIGHNRIYNLNGSLLPLKHLKILNLTHNDIVDFNLQELRGLRKLMLLDVSHNKIRVISGKFGNSVELEPKVIDLRMEYNELRSLYGGLTGFKGLQRVNLSHNLLETITADDIKGLDDLLILDISYNHLTTLDGTSQIVLNSLEELKASHNWMSSLETDFYGLPKLCWADFSFNKISFVAAGLADKTQCRLYGVNSTLRIYLQGNPAMCDATALTAITRLESRNNTKVQGINECPPPPPPTTAIPWLHTTTTTLATTTTLHTTYETTSTSTTAASTTAQAEVTTSPNVVTTLAQTAGKYTLSFPYELRQTTTPQPLMENDIPTRTATQSTVDVESDVKTATPQNGGVTASKMTTTPKYVVFDIEYIANDLTVPANLP